MEATLTLLRELELLIPAHDWSLNFRFRGDPTRRDEVTVTLDVDSNAFGDRGGADLTAGRRSGAAMRSGEAMGCSMPFPAARQRNRAVSVTYDLDPGEQEHAAEIAAAGMIRALPGFRKFILELTEAMNAGKLLTVMKVAGGAQTGLTVKLYRSHGTQLRRSRLGDAEW